MELWKKINVPPYSPHDYMHIHHFSSTVWWSDSGGCILVTMELAPVFLAVESGKTDNIMGYRTQSLLLTSNQLSGHFGKNRGKLVIFLAETCRNTMETGLTFGLHWTEKPLNHFSCIIGLWNHQLQQLVDSYIWVMGYSVYVNTRRSPVATWSYQQTSGFQFYSPRLVTWNSRK